MTTYFDINESTAKQAKEYRSFNDYEPGSATAEYRRMVDRVAAIAEAHKQEVTEFYHPTIDKLVTRYAKVLADYINRDNEIGCRCPSVLICGGGNFPVKKKLKQVDAWEKNRENWEKAERIIDRIRSTGTGGIDFRDPEAGAVLRDKLAKLEKQSSDMKKVNAYYKKHETLEGCTLLDEQEKAKLTLMMERYHCRPYISAELSGVRDQINRTKKRIEQLEKREATQQEQEQAQPETFNGGHIVRNYDADRLQIFFEGKPDAEVRNRLKSNGFRWAPSVKAWQRQLTENAERALKRLELA